MRQRQDPRPLERRTLCDAGCRGAGAFGTLPQPSQDRDPRGVMLKLRPEDGQRDNAKPCVTSES
jgi:hypothetical protein